MCTARATDVVWSELFFLFVRSFVSYSLGRLRYNIHENTLFLLLFLFYLLHFWPILYTFVNSLVRLLAHFVFYSASAAKLCYTWSKWGICYSNKMYTSILLFLIFFFSVFLLRFTFCLLISKFVVLVFILCVLFRASYTHTCGV